MLPTLNQALDIVENTLKTVEGMTEKVFHFESFKRTDNYIVWAEEGQDGDTFVADDAPLMQSLTGTIDYYTLTERDKVVSKIQKALTGAGIGWELNSIQHEMETGYIHYEWVWKIGSDPNGTDDVSGI